MSVERSDPFGFLRIGSLTRVNLLLLPGRNSNLADTTQYCVSTAAESPISQPRTQPTELTRLSFLQTQLLLSIFGSRRLFGFADSFLCRPNPDRKSTRLNSSHLGISYA